MSRDEPQPERQVSAVSVTTERSSRGKRRLRAKTARGNAKKARSVGVCRGLNGERGGTRLPVVCAWPVCTVAERV